MSPAPREDASLWVSVDRDEAEAWRGRHVILGGYVVARAPRSVVLLRKPLEKDEEGLPAFDTDKCIALMVSPDQFRLLKRKGRLRVSGQFSTVNARPPDSVVTHVESKGRTISVSCATASGILPFIFVERLDF